MTRQFFWVAAALALSLPLQVIHNRAVAQQTGDASAEAEADTGDASADASADAGAESNDQADAQPESSDSSTQADSQSNASDDSTQADAQTESSDAAAKDETQGATNDSQDTQTDDANADANANDNQSTQDGTPAVPPPSTQTDPNANQSSEQSRVVDGQQRDQKDADNRDRADASRDRSDDSSQDRANRGDRNRRDRDNDLRVGIRFGRATDRGLTIDHIDRNSFYHNSGFRRGDVIISVHGRPVRNDADFMRFFVLEQGQRVPIVVLRDYRRETIYVEYRDVAQNQCGF